MLERLQQFQASNEELAKLTSISSIQTKGLKRHFFEEAHPEKSKRKKDANNKNQEVKLNSISSSKRTKLLHHDTQLKVNDPNIVGFENSDTDTSENDDGTNSDTNEMDIEMKQEIEPVIESINNNVIMIEDGLGTHTEIKNEQEKCSKREKTHTVVEPAVYVNVMRNEDIQKSRLKLPILAEEQEIMETINDNSVIILAGLYYIYIYIYFQILSMQVIMYH